MVCGLHWFRADLRIADNTALIQAVQACDHLLGIFIIPTKTFICHHEASIKVQFILNNLKLLTKQLEKQGIPLLIRRTDYFSGCPRILKDICLNYQVNRLYFNKQYEVDEVRRDEGVKKTLRGLGVEVYTYDDQTILPPRSVVSLNHQPLKIFTSFKKVWLTKTFGSDAWKPAKNPAKTFSNIVKADAIPDSIVGFQYGENMQAWLAGEEQAQKVMNTFCSEKIHRYQSERDFPFLNATSRLSAYLAQGVISPRQCLEAIIKNLNMHSIHEILEHRGPAAWLSELIWREFYKHILYYFPQVCRHKPLRVQTEKIIWRNNPRHFQAWAEGLTGFPLVDAAMRQLNQTGWMHNRLRMLTAVFLSKILFLDWRLGEQYFMEKLIDGDFSANNGGWQWSASTGTDAVPYFRLFNPILQSERYDPEGHFIRQYCPELKELNNALVHNPYASGVLTGALNYPHPIVDYKQRRQQAIQAFKQNLEHLKK